MEPLAGIGPKSLLFRLKRARFYALFNLKDAPPEMCFDEFLRKSCFLLRATYKIVRFCVSLNGKSQFLYLLRRFEKSFPVMVITRQQQDVVPSATG
jgi:hypothetical protein